MRETEEIASQIQIFYLVTEELGTSIFIMVHSLPFTKL